MTDEQRQIIVKRWKQICKHSYPLMQALNNATNFTYDDKYDNYLQRKMKQLTVELGDDHHVAVDPYNLPPGAEGRYPWAYDGIRIILSRREIVILTFQDPLNIQVKQL